MSHRVLSDADLKARGVRFSRQHRYRLIKDGLFPAPIKMGPATNGWLESEIDQWIEARAAARTQSGKAA